MRALLIFVLGMMFLTGQAAAQEDNVAAATSALQGVLSTLKESVQKLSLDNDRLAACDRVLKLQVAQLQNQSGLLDSQGELLNKSAEKLHESNPRRAQQIADLEEQNLEADQHLRQSEGAVTLARQSLDARHGQEEQLLLKFQDGQGVMPASVRDEGSLEDSRRQKERLKLMKMIYDSQQRQEGLQKEILRAQKDPSLLPSAAALAHQQLLKEQIKGLEAEIAAYPPDKPAMDSATLDRWNDAHLGQLEGELKSLEQNYAQLKTLMEQMSQKAKITASQHAEGEKLQSSLDDLSHQAVGLKADLDDLRSKMIELDKRKSRLEAMIRQSP